MAAVYQLLRVKLGSLLVHIDNRWCKQSAIQKWYRVIRVAVAMILYIGPHLACLGRANRRDGLNMIARVEVLVVGQVIGYDPAQAMPDKVNRRPMLNILLNKLAHLAFIAPRQ